MNNTILYQYLVVIVIFNLPLIYLYQLRFLKVILLLSVWNITFWWDERRCRPCTRPTWIGFLHC